MKANCPKQRRSTMAQIEQTVNLRGPFRFRRPVVCVARTTLCGMLIKIESKTTSATNLHAYVQHSGYQINIFFMLFFHVPFSLMNMELQAGLAENACEIHHLVYRDSRQQPQRPLTMETVLNSTNTTVNAFPLLHAWIIWDKTGHSIVCFCKNRNSDHQNQVVPSDGSRPFNKSSGILLSIISIQNQTSKKVEFAACRQLWPRDSDWNRRCRNREVRSQATAARERRVYRLFRPRRLKLPQTEQRGRSSKEGKCCATSVNLDAARIPIGISYVSSSVNAGKLSESFGWRVFVEDPTDAAAASKRGKKLRCGVLKHVLSVEEITKICIYLSVFQPLETPQTSLPIAGIRTWSVGFSVHCIIENFLQSGTQTCLGSHTFHRSQEPKIESCSSWAYPAIRTRSSRRTSKRRMKNKIKMLIKKKKNLKPIDGPLARIAGDNSMAQPTELGLKVIVNYFVVEFEGNYCIILDRLQSINAQKCVSLGDTSEGRSEALSFHAVSSSRTGILPSTILSHRHPGKHLKCAHGNDEQRPLAIHVELSERESAEKMAGLKKHFKVTGAFLYSLVQGGGAYSPLKATRATKCLVGECSSELSYGTQPCYFLLVLWLSRLRSHGENLHYINE
ncbi:unnamed protein product [Nesidiocoris tenuis]|uniref:Uncharacterized protein n=1 Tax=Nesidiocoris tenuis TaxID=355587 RepID=A0A6H5HML5_9HEMI|nr:unnamed protein product [Nesidiocoris tenuis]